MISRRSTGLDAVKSVAVCACAAGIPRLGCACASPGPRRSGTETVTANGEQTGSATKETSSSRPAVWLHHWCPPKTCRGLCWATPTGHPRHYDYSALLVPHESLIRLSRTLWVASLQVTRAKLAAALIAHSMSHYRLLAFETAATSWRNNTVSVGPSSRGLIRHDTSGRCGVGEHTIEPSFNESQLYSFGKKERRWKSMPLSTYAG